MGHMSYASHSSHRGWFHPHTTPSTRSLHPHLPRIVRRRDLFALAAIALVAAGYTIGIVWNRARHSGAIGNYDNYALYYPNLLYARDSLRLGEGVLWNRFQNCGQPFFAIAATAILYPPHAVYLFFTPHTGLFVLTALHFLLAGSFAYALFRELDLSTSAALAGSVAFQLGGITLSLAFWSQTLVGHFIWIPAAMAVCERILRRPAPMRVCSSASF